MAGNKAFARATRAKNDEFYTQLVDIEAELRHYRDQFRGKVVFCNCDDPYESNFFKYFAMNFDYLGLKKLITTAYTGSPITGKQLSLLDIEGMPKDVPEKPAYRVEITEVPDANNDGAIDLYDVEYLLKKNERNVLTLLAGRRRLPLRRVHRAAGRGRHRRHQPAVLSLPPVRRPTRPARQAVPHPRQPERHHLQ